MNTTPLNESDRAFTDWKNGKLPEVISWDIWSPAEIMHSAWKAGIEWSENRTLAGIDNPEEAIDKVREALKWALRAFPHYVEFHKQAEEALAAITPKP